MPLRASLDRTTFEERTKRSRRALSASLAALFLTGGLASAQAAEDICDVQAPRVVAVGDVHGAYDHFVEVLRMAGLVDDGAHWVGGTTHLVQTGDILDRGEAALEVIDLLMRLEKEAEKAGGRVHVLLGNHEVMNLLGDLRYVNPIEFQRFRTADSMRRVQRLYERQIDLARARANEAGEEFDAGAYRDKLEEQIPLGYVERARAFTANGKYGSWLRRRHAVARVNGVVLLHGGLTPEVAALGCKAINDTVRREITKDIDKTRNDPLSSLSAGASGPFWYRGLAQEDETAYAPSINGILEAMDAQAVVVAHTVTKTGRIQDRFNGRVVMIDVGMSPAYAGSLAALEIGGDGTMTALYPDVREVLGPALAEPSSVPADQSLAARP
jgi:3',5'-cyclic AMP phosphodiesterase CpdA